MSELELGQRVRVLAIVEVKRERLGPFDSRRSLWANPMPPDIEGIVVGERLMSEGMIDHDSEYGNTFTQTRRHKVVLVATSLSNIAPCFERDVVLL